MKKYRLTACLTALASGICIMTAPLLTAFADGYPFRTTCSYYYDQFDDNARLLYDRLLAASQTVDDSYENFTEVPRVPCPDMPYAQLKDTVFMFMYDHPEFFWLANNYSYNYGSYGTFISLQIYPGYQSGEARQQAKSELIAIEQDFIDGAMQFDTDYERAKYLTDRLYQDITYQTGSLDQSIASALLQKQTVCAGFSKAYSLLANAVGVDTISFTGCEHGWNGTKIAGNWYHNDVTNALFLYSDSEMDKVDSRVSRTIVTDSNGNESTYEMHDLYYAYYTDIFPDMSLEYDGSREILSESTAPVSSDVSPTDPEETPTEPPTTQSPTETTAETQPSTVLPTSANTETDPEEENSPTKVIIESTTGTDGSITEKYYEITASPSYYFAENTVALTPRYLIDQLWQCEMTTFSNGGYSSNSTRIVDLRALQLDSGWQTPAEVYAHREQGSNYFHGSLPASFEGTAMPLGDVWVVHRGDYDLNGVTNAADASLVLMYAAEAGSGNAKAPETDAEKLAFFAAKLAKDSPDSLTAADAAEILIYAAELGAGIG